MATKLDELGPLGDAIREEGRRAGRAEAERQFFGASAAVLTLGLLADSTGALASRIRSHNPAVADFFDGQSALYASMAAPPQVVSVTPADGASAAPAAQAVTVVFANSIHPGSVTEANFFLMPDSGGTHLAATVVYDPATRSVGIVPESELTAGVLYRVTVLGVVANEAGFPMAVDFTSVFQVAGA